MDNSNILLNTPSRKNVGRHRKPRSWKSFTLNEVIQDTQNNITSFRQIKYEQINNRCVGPVLTQTGSGLQWNSFGIDDRSPSALVEDLAKLGLKSANASPNKETPMDIDSSGNVSMNSSGDLGQNKIITRRTNQRIDLTVDSTKSNKFRPRRFHKQTPIKKTATKTAPYNQSLTKQFSSAMPVMFLILLALIGYFLIGGSISRVYVDRQIQLDNIKHDLNSVLYQSNVVRIITEAFERFGSWPQSVKLLAFIGSSGIGKTFTANILKRNFVPLLVNELNAQSLKSVSKLNEIYTSLSNMNCNLIIIDDLSAQDGGNVIDFVAKIPKDLSVLVISIFNEQNSIEYDFIHNTFLYSDCYYELVYFNTVKTKEVEYWLRQELHKRHIDEHRHPELIKRLLDNDQIERKGFKGINTKLLLALDNVY